MSTLYNDTRKRHAGNIGPANAFKRSKPDDSADVNTHAELGKKDSNSIKSKWLTRLRQQAVVIRVNSLANKTTAVASPKKARVMSKWTLQGTSWLQHTPEILHIWTKIKSEIWYTPSNPPNLWPFQSTLSKVPSDFDEESRKISVIAWAVCSHGHLKANTKAERPIRVLPVTMSERATLYASQTIVLSGSDLRQLFKNYDGRLQIREKLVRQGVGINRKQSSGGGTTFKCFSFLPIKLRRKIWCDAFHVPELITLNLVCLPLDGAASDYTINCTVPFRCVVSAACKFSHKIGAELLALSQARGPFQKVNDSTGMVNTDIDVFCMTKLGYEMLDNLDHGGCPYKRLAVDARYLLTWGEEKCVDVFERLISGNNVKEIILVIDCDDTINVPGLCKLSDNPKSFMYTPHEWFTNEQSASFGSGNRECTWETVENNFVKFLVEQKAERLKANDWIIPKIRLMTLKLDASKFLPYLYRSEAIWWACSPRCAIFRHEELFSDEVCSQFLSLFSS